MAATVRNVEERLWLCEMSYGDVMVRIRHLKHLVTVSKKGNGHYSLKYSIID